MRNRSVIPLLLQVFLLPISAMSQVSPVLVLKTRIPLAKVEGRMDHLAVDVKGQRVFATAIDHKTLEIIDLQTRKQAHTITDLDRPQGAYFDLSTNRLFVACGGDGTVKIFDGTTYQLVGTVKLSADADNVRYDARAKRILVGYGGEKFLNGKAIRGAGDGALAFIDLTGKKTGEIAVDAHPESFQLEKLGTRVFVNVPDRSEIQVADLAANKVIAHWPVAKCVDSFPMTLDEAHHLLFIGCREPSSVQAYNTATGKLTASFEAMPSDDIFYDAAKSRIYVLGNDIKGEAQRVGPGSVQVFQQKDPDHYAKIAQYPTGPGAWTGFFSADLGEIFVATRKEGDKSSELLVFETK
jgi:DNA-binding beta-propeller fold protein YncE